MKGIMAQESITMKTSMQTDGRASENSNLETIRQLQQQISKLKHVSTHRDWSH